MTFAFLETESGSYFPFKWSNFVTEATV